MAAASRRIVALLLSCSIIFNSSFLLVAASTADSDVCKANDPREECLADDTIAAATADDEDAPHCVDEHDDCRHWSENDECNKNPDYMLLHCKKSCKVCGIVDDTDFGLPQEIPRTANFNAIKQIIAKSTEYMKVINGDEKYKDVRSKCQNQHAECSQWALGSGCDDNPNFMKQQCAPACQSCDHILEMHERCKPDPNSKNAIENGGMDLLFETIIMSAMDTGYDVTIWSRPKKMPNEHGQLKPCEEDDTNPCGVPDGPWVVTLENFVSEKEVNVLKEWGSKMGYERSQAGDQILDVRTSSQAVRT